MNQDTIRIRGAREHNLKNISIDLPRDRFIVITGLSGSGKSTLAFDTIYAEGQRRYVESLSAYARQFLGIMNKPDVDSIDGLSPAISIEQKTTSKNPRSTVGTVTEIYDYLRLLFSRIGVMHCPHCSASIRPQSAENIVSFLLSRGEQDIFILAPIVRGMKGTHEKVFETLLQEGCTRARIDGKLIRLDEAHNPLERYEKHWIDAVIDSVTTIEEQRHRITEAVEAALQKGNGTILVIGRNKTQDKKENTTNNEMENKSQARTKEIARGIGETTYSSHGACPNHPNVVFEQLEPRMFSFNSPFGACTSCLGLGEHLKISEELLIPDETKSIMDGALAIYGKMDLQWRCQQIAAVGKKYGFDVFTPFNKFTKKQRDVLLYGTRDVIHGVWSTGAQMHMDDGWEGVIPQTMRLYRQTESEWRKEDIEKFMSATPCSVCKGKRLKETMLAVKVADKSIIDVTEMSIEKCAEYFKNLESHLTEKDIFIAKQVLKEISSRLGFLLNVGLNYLSLARAARTLSGGEAQRIRLATQIGSNLMGVLYILDEPSIGLHQRDNEKLINTLHNLRDLGNTLIVVEHDEDTIRAADYIVDMGPGAGTHGGNICAKGTPTEIASNKHSITGAYLSCKSQIEIPHSRRKSTEFLTIQSAKENNLKHTTVHFPTHVLCGITGVSGSGKSTLMNQTLIPALQKHFGGTPTKIGSHTGLQIPNGVDSVIVIDQDPIGKTPRSNPATYTKLFDEIRELFASTKEARSRGYTSGRFSFNVKGGRCEKCQGDGVLKIEMNFLPDVYVTCEDCKGKRYNAETLDVHYKEKSIADVLSMNCEEAAAFFANHTSIMRKLDTLNEVGLGYITLGQSATTLSGGESQRIKLTRELAKAKRGSTLYLLDEPTTGLHFEDVRKLICVLNRLVDKGNSVFVIEHNLDVIKCCDYIIDLGPEGGDKGGEVIAKGTPEEVMQAQGSYTGMFLKKLMKGKTRQYTYLSEKI